MPSSCRVWVGRFTSANCGSNCSRQAAYPARRNSSWCLMVAVACTQASSISRGRPRCPKCVAPMSSRSHRRSYCRLYRDRIYGRVTRPTRNGQAARAAARQLRIRARVRSAAHGRRCAGRMARRVATCTRASRPRVAHVFDRQRRSCDWPTCARLGSRDVARAAAEKCNRLTKAKMGGSHFGFCERCRRHPRVARRRGLARGSRGAKHNHEWFRSSQFARADLIILERLLRTPLATTMRRRCLASAWES